MSCQCLILISTMGLEQQNSSRRMEELLISYKFDFIKVDGSSPEEKELRDKLFEVSGMRGKYPQCFLVMEDKSYKFIGTWDVVEGFAECESLPADILAANPQIQTMSNVFVNAKKLA